MEKKQLGKMMNIAIPILAVLLIVESIYAVASLKSGTGIVSRVVRRKEVISSPVAMKMSAEPAEIKVGEEFTLWVQAELLEDYKVSGSDVFVGFDKKGFKVVEEKKELALEKSKNFPKVLRALLNKEDSQVVVSVVSDGGVELEGGSMVDLVGIKFMALESGKYNFSLIKKGDDVKAGSTFVEQNNDASEIKFTVEDLSVSVI